MPSGGGRPPHHKPVWWKAAGNARFSRFCGRNPDVAGSREGPNSEVAGSVYCFHESFEMFAIRAKLEN